MLKYQISLSQFEFFDQVWSIDYFVNLTLLMYAIERALIDTD